MALPAQTALLRLLIVAAALCGAFVVTHLKLQERNGFANGCTGLAAAPAETVGCAEVTQGAYGKQFGVSNITWGFVFYGLMILLRLGYSATADDRLRLAGFGLAGVGVLYAAYLVYIQAAVIHQFCALCLTSSTFVLTLLVLHGLEARRISQPSMPTAASRRAPAPRRGLKALRPYAPILGAFALLVIADVAWASRSGAAAPASETPAGPLAGGALPSATDPTAALTGVPATAAETCGFDPTIAPIADMAPFTTGPFEGSPDASAVTVVEIFDPNCPHCRDLAAILAPIKTAEAARARFYVLPYPLREQSVAQVVALKAAEREGKFAALVEEMFRRQDQNWGMPLPELVATLDAVGMDGAAFQTTLQNPTALQPLLAQVQANAAAVGTAFASRDGGISTPRVAVGNRVVLGTSFTPECVGRLIGEAAAAR